MQKFDLIVIGAGSGLNVSSAAADIGMRVAIVEKGPMGGTCLNRGCIPSKIIIHSADVAETIRKSKFFGIRVKKFYVDFKKIIKNASDIVDKDARELERAIREDKNTTQYKTTGKFIGERILKVGDEAIKGNKIVIAAGTRSFIPPIEGLKDAGFITSDEALRLIRQPKVLTIIGGGYIAAELAHFFGSLGTKINILQRNKFLVPAEDLEIRERFTKIYSRKYNVYTNFNVNRVVKKNGKFIVHASSINGKKQKIVKSDELLVAAGRIPNTDILGVEKAGVKIDKKGFIITNRYLETTAKNVWALGDIAGNYLFKHSANLESQYVFNNAILNKKIKIDYTAMPSAIFSSPQIADVGCTEEELKEKNIDYAAGRYDYIKTGMGTALQDNDGFVKILADRKTRKILGCHILGEQASTLIHEVVVAMKAGLKADAISKAVHVHPALSEVVQRAVNNIGW